MVSMCFITIDKIVMEHNFIRLWVSTVLCMLAYGHERQELSLDHMAKKLRKKSTAWEEDNLSLPIAPLI